MCAICGLEKLKIIDLKMTITETICVIIKIWNSTISTILRNNPWECPPRVSSTYWPVDIKKGMRNRPDNTRSRRVCRLWPSKGRAPHTNTYSTTPRLCKHSTPSLYCEHREWVRNGGKEWGTECSRKGGSVAGKEGGREGGTECSRKGGMDGL